jgi:DUF971 family protein
MNKTKIPLKISLNKNSELLIVWNDDSVNEIKLKLLRDECPCAGCKGETILGKVHLPIFLPTYKPGMYEIKNIETVGVYAIQLFWKDNHNTGIYTYEYLQLLANLT